MTSLAAALSCELRKARRSPVPLWTAAGFTLAPLAGGLFMFILEDPARARALGLLGAKAQLTMRSADWPTFLGMMAQATAVGSSLLFALLTAWIFGREFAERTVKLLLAVPTPREAIVAAKFAVAAASSALLVAWIFVVALVVGTSLDLPGWSREVLIRGVLDVAGTGALAILLIPPSAFLASASRGYLAPIGFAILTVFLAQIAAATGWGAFFPWAVPALWSGLAGPRSGQVGGLSYALVVLVSLAGLAGTFAWWRRADHVA
jgi:ABC-2 type transport system permease protein